MKKLQFSLCLVLLIILYPMGNFLLADEPIQRDIYADTWVASDALGRLMPTSAEVGKIKTDKKRIVSIFYVTWHTRDHHSEFENSYMADVTKILEKDPSARLDGNHPLWAKKWHHWAEPEMGYFLSQDEYVIRKDLSMLADAGVDVLVLDVTNGIMFYPEWEVLFTTMQKMKEEGNQVPQFCFWAFNGPVITRVQELYEKYYKQKRFSDLWFYWNGKPLLLYNATPQVDSNSKKHLNKNPNYDPNAATNPNHPHYGNPDYTSEIYFDYTSEVKTFFTLRNMWWGYYEWGKKPFVGKENNWSFGYDLGDEKVRNLPPDKLVSVYRGEKEQAAVTPAQHASSNIGKCWSRKTLQPPLNDYDKVDSAYVPWLGKMVQHPEAYGIYFQERWNEALQSDPKMIYLNDWNEWTAIKFTPEKLGVADSTGRFPFLSRSSNFVFVDQYNAEFNRGIQPMKGGYTDNYYMQMIQNIRKYKGVREIPLNRGLNHIKIDGKFTDWAKVTVEYRDTKGDVTHRNHPGYGGLFYTNYSGRNDIITSKVAVSASYIAFYVETALPLTPFQDSNWMLLLIDADKNSNTGWYGYDFIVNRMVGAKQTSLSRYQDNAWIKVAEIPYKMFSNQLELSIPRRLMDLKTNAFTFDFKWTDNATTLSDPISLCTDGDTAPNRRFNYRFIWEK